jgi:hypothetical protein
MYIKWMKYKLYKLIILIIILMWPADNIVSYTLVVYMDDVLL